MRKKPDYNSEARKRASAKYEEKYAKHIIRVDHELDAKLIAYCENNGESLNGYIIRLIKEDMGIK